MSSPSATIDLGVIDTGADDDASPLLARSLRPRFAARTAHWWPTAMIALALTLSTTSSSAPAPPWLTPHFSAPASAQHLLDEHTLYAVDQPISGGFRAVAAYPPRRKLTAYRLVDGAVKWTVPLRTGARLELQNGVPLLLSQPTLDRPGSVTALDPDTGDQRWARAGRLAGQVAGQPVLVETDAAAGRPATGTAPRTARLIVIDPATGRQTLTLTGDPVGFGWGEAGGRGYVVALTRERTLRAYDAASGTRLAATQVDHVAARTTPKVVGDVLLLWSSLGNGPSLRAYDVASLTPRWTVDLRSKQRGQLVPCGRLICLYSRTAPIALDPSTGAVVWSADWLRRARVGLATFRPAAPWPDGYLVAEAPSPDQHTTWLVTAETGRPLLDLRGWEPQIWAGAASTEADPIFARHERGVTWFARPRLDAPGVEVLGTLERPSRQVCRVTAEYLVCQSRREAHVWRLPEPARQPARLPWGGDPVAGYFALSERHLRLPRPGARVGAGRAADLSHVRRCRRDQHRGAAG